MMSAAAHAESCFCSGGEMDAAPPLRAGPRVLRVTGRRESESDRGRPSEGMPRSMEGRGIITSSRGALHRKVL
eukprot:6189546-Pleurochrysis_carterae.AAC.1